MRLDGINTCGAVTREGRMEPDDEDETKGRRGKKEKRSSKSRDVVNLAVLDFPIPEIEFSDTVIVEISFTSFIMSKEIF